MATKTRNLYDHMHIKNHKKCGRNWGLGQMFKGIILQQVVNKS